MQKHLVVGLFGFALGALGCTAEAGGETDGGVGAGGQGGGVGAAGGHGNGNGNGNQGGVAGPTGGEAGPTGGTPGPTGGDPGPTGGDPGPTGGDPGPTGGTQGAGGEPIGADGGLPEVDAGEALPPGGVDVEGDPGLLGLIAAEEASCRASCAQYDVCGWLDAELDPPETVASCEADCSYSEADRLDLTRAASRDLLAAMLTSGDVLIQCITALSCEDMTHYFDEDVDPYPCEAEEGAYYAAAEAAFPPVEVPDFMCADGSTVPGDYACDGEPDCEDGSDEVGCP